MTVSSLISLTDAQAGWGTISYQAPSAISAYVFNGLRDFRLRGEPEWDDAHRVIMFTRYTLILHCFIVDASTGAHDTTMSNIRQQLQEAGGILKITGTGVSDISINSFGGTNDVDWGPKPQPLDILQIGTVGTELTWTCTFAVKEGASANLPLTALLAFNYGIEVSYDDGGVATRTINGNAIIPLSRVQNAANGDLPRSADSIRNSIECFVPPGMQRISQRFALSLDKKRLDFTFVDKQLEAEAPPFYSGVGGGILDCDIDYEIENSDPLNFASWFATLSGSITVPRGTQPVVAAKTFMLILLDKYSKLIASAKTGTVIPMRIRMGRTITTRRARFFVQFLVVACFDDLMKAGGLWQQLDQTSYDRWAAYLVAQGVWQPGGTNLLFYQPNDDAIIDLKVTSPDLSIGRSPGGPPLPIPTPDQLTFRTQLGSQKWIRYENSLDVYREQSTIRHYTSSMKTLSELYSLPEAASGANLEPVASGVTNTTQITGNPKEFVLMHGYGVYAGTPTSQPAVPSLQIYNNRRTLVKRQRYDGPTAIGCIFGATVYKIRWAVLYELLEYAQGTPVMANKTLCCAQTTIDSKGNPKP